MELILFNTLFEIIPILFLFAIGRLILVSRHVDKRIDEVFASDNWEQYDIGIDDAYDVQFWNLHKWTYRQFYPEVIV